MDKKQREIIMEERKRWLFFALPFTFTKYTLTDRKLTVNEGLLVSKENEILLYRILDITYTRSLFQKLFGLGSITIESQDITSPTFVIKNIKNSRNFKEEISELVEKEKIRLRVRSGEVIGANDHAPHFNEFHDDAADCDYQDGF